MRRVAVLAGHSFPPMRGPGSRRVLAWCEHLPKHAWDVVVVTTPSDYRPQQHPDDELDEVAAGVTVVRTRPLLLRRVPRAIAAPADARHAGPRWRGWARRVGTAALIPDARILWAPRAVSAVRWLARSGGVDVLLSTSPESSTHLAAAVASARSGVPWVADLRDPWEPRWWVTRGALRGRLELTMARRVLRRADRVTVVSEGLGSLVASRYGVDPKRIVHLPHGFDGSAVGRCETTLDRGGGDEVFTVCHTGKVYAWDRALRPFLDAVAESARQIRVRMIGDWDPEAFAMVGQHAEAPWLELSESVPAAAAVQEQHRADALLLLPGPGMFTVPSKTYEYLATGRPVLALCGKDSDTARLLSGFPQARTVAPTDTAGVKQAIETLARDRAGLISDRENATRLGPYERREVVATLARLLDDMSSSDVSQTSV